MKLITDCNGSLMCPLCGEFHTHQGKTEISRGGDITIYMECEYCHGGMGNTAFLLSIRQYKGNTIIETLFIDIDDARGSIMDVKPIHRNH